MEERAGWRLTNQGRYLKGKTLLRRRYAARRPDWDHDHCEFCWAKFTETEEPETLQEGYVTEDHQHWICHGCFADFQEQFQWTTKEE